MTPKEDYLKYFKYFEGTPPPYEEWLETMYTVRTTSYERRGRMIKEICTKRDKYNTEVFNMLTEIKEVLEFYANDVNWPQHAYEWGPLVFRNIQADCGAKAINILNKYFKEENNED